ncbi:MAG: fructose-bisphosphatase class II [Maricaulis sp.]|jgi:fructose-1,6-bisphosphatase II / sedoheptulose-1,7-bisphosphatase|nr:fructose-bisphosphatase class II [Maricaulis sp.]HAQ36008.1 fructose-bisphosphatase class II [Alphaproteobacteria bacterium]
MSDATDLQNLAFAAARAAEDAAIAASVWIGRSDKEAADQAAVDALRTGLNAMPMRGRIVIGEGERDEAPMLFIGEEVGTGSGPEIDIALDPLEGTSLTAKGMANALAVLALSPRGGLLHAPDTYMDKIAVGPGLPRGVVDLDNSVEDNIRSLAKAKGCEVGDITACVLERERHQKIMDALRSLGCRVILIPDGDVAGVIATTDPDTGIDIYIGQGGAPEGVLAASALRCVGGQMQTRLFFRNDDERARAAKTGVKDLNRKYSLNELASKDCMFIATGVTDGTLLDGVHKTGEFIETETLIMQSADKSVRRLFSRRPKGA